MEITFSEVYLLLMIELINCACQIIWVSVQFIFIFCEKHLKKPFWDLILEKEQVSLIYWFYPYAEHAILKSVCVTDSVGFQLLRF